MSYLLVVEDEEHLAQGLVYNLRNAGYDVDLATTGEEAIRLVEDRTAEQQVYDLILLDVMLPGINGDEVARRLRLEGHMQPIVMVSARDRSSDTVAGLDAGADDYITKPFDIDEVLARLRVALRRQVWGRAQSNGQLAAPPPQAALESVQYGEWRIDLKTFIATHEDGRELRLTPKEVAMLRLFGERPGEVISRDTFLEEVWEVSGAIETRTVDNFIRKLRQALEEDSSNPRHIVSVRGAGYRFVP